MVGLVPLKALGTDLEKPRKGSLPFLAFGAICAPWFMTSSRITPSLVSVITSPTTSSDPPASPKYPCDHIQSLPR